MIKKLENIINDVKFLDSLNIIKSNEIKEVYEKLLSENTKAYINNLMNLSKQEEALSDAFFKGRESFLAIAISERNAPEVKVKDGFVDFKVGEGRDSFLLELKPFFKQSIKTENGVKKIQHLAKMKLDWKDHESQIKNYLKKDNEYVVLTNLSEWLIFNDKTLHRDFKPIVKFTIEEFLNEYDADKSAIENFKRISDQATKSNLDDEFLECLNNWVAGFEKVQYEKIYDNQNIKPDEIIVDLINKFIFIQTLDDYGAIQYNWLYEEWNHINQKWSHKGKYTVIEKFIEALMDWFDINYDTELFSKEIILKTIKMDKNNIDNFHDIFVTVMGVEYNTDVIAGKGIKQFDFRKINEDVFGKAYEKFLAKNRHKDGIYYTPSFITESINNITVKPIFNRRIELIKKMLDNDDFAGAEKQILELQKITVFDPACGSGSFLIKAFRLIFYNYDDLRQYLYKKLNKYPKQDAFTISPQQSNICKLIAMLSMDNPKDMIFSIITRHLFGNDLDEKALKIARINIWLEAIKLAPDQFRFDKISNNRILPHLEINLTNHDAIASPHPKFVLSQLEEFALDIKKMSELRIEYLNNRDPIKLEKILRIKSSIGNMLNESYENVMSGIFATIPDNLNSLFYPLDFWFNYYDKDGNILNENEQGFDCIIGNPPYLDIRTTSGNKKGDYSEFMKTNNFESTTGSFNISNVFVEFTSSLIKLNGIYSVITSNTFLRGQHGRGLRQHLVNSNKIMTIFDFKDQQLFKGATTYTVILLLTRSPKSENFNYIIAPRIDKTVDQIVKLFKESENSDIYRLERSKLGDEWELTPDISGIDLNPTVKLTEISNIRNGVQTDFDKLFAINLIDQHGRLATIMNQFDGNYHEIELNFLKKRLKMQHLSPFNITSDDAHLLIPYKLVNNEYISLEKIQIEQDYPNFNEYLEFYKDELQQNTKKGNWWEYNYQKLDVLRQFNQRKIISPLYSKYPKFALDERGDYCYTVGGGGCISIIPKKLQLLKINQTFYYLLGLLNSILIGKYMLNLSGRGIQGNYSSKEKLQLKELPIFLPTKKSLSMILDIADIAEKLTSQKNMLNLQTKKWNEKSVTYDNIKLIDVINKHNWFEAIYDKKQTNTKYDTFRMRIFDEKIIRIYGIKNQKAIQLLELKFNENIILQHLTFSIAKFFNSRFHKNNLKDILNKTEIPVSLPNYESINLIINDIFKKNIREELVTTLLTNIFELECKLNAYVFKLYGIKIANQKLICDKCGIDNMEYGLIYEQVILNSGDCNR